MNRAMYYIGLGVAAAAFLSLIYIEKANNSAQGVIGGLIAAAIIGGCILMGFADEIKNVGKMGKPLGMK